MTTVNDEDLDELDELLNGDEVSSEEILSNISEFKSEKLCDIIITYRYLGFYKDIYQRCMEELANRRLHGDVFDFENYIENNFQSLPKIEFKLNDFSGAISQIKKFTNK